MTRKKYFCLSILLLCTSNILSQESIQYTRYSPLNFSSLGKSWVIDFGSDDGAMKWYMQTMNGIEGSRSVPDLLYISKRDMSIAKGSDNRICGANALIENIAADGELRYYLGEGQDEPHCLPGSNSILLKMSGPDSIQATVLGPTGEVLFAGVALPDPRLKIKTKLTELSQEELTHNKLLLGNKDKFIGYWSGEIDGEKIEFYTKYKKIPGKKRVVGWNEGYIISKSSNCILTFGSGNGIPTSGGIYEKDLKKVGMEKTPYKYINTLGISIDKPVPDLCSKFSPLFAWLERGNLLTMGIGAEGNTVLTKYNWKTSPSLLDYDVDLVDTALIKRGVLSKRMRKLLSIKLPKVGEYLNSKRAEIYYKPEKTFDFYWEAEASRPDDPTSTFEFRLAAMSVMPKSIENFYAVYKTGDVTTFQHRGTIIYNWMYENYVRSSDGLNGMRGKVSYKGNGVLKVEEQLSKHEYAQLVGNNPTFAKCEVVYAPVIELSIKPVLISNSKGFYKDRFAIKQKSKACMLSTVTHNSSNNSCKSVCNEYKSGFEPTYENMMLYKDKELAFKIARQKFQ